MAVITKFAHLLQRKMTLTYEEFKLTPVAFAENMLKVVELKNKWGIELTELEASIPRYQNRVRLEVAGKLLSQERRENA